MGVSRERDSREGVRVEGSVRRERDSKEREIREVM